MNVGGGGGGGSGGVERAPRKRLRDAADACGPLLQLQSPWPPSLPLPVPLVRAPRSRHVAGAEDVEWPAPRNDFVWPDREQHYEHERPARHLVQGRESESAEERLPWLDFMERRRMRCASERRGGQGGALPVLGTCACARRVPRALPAYERALRLAQLGRVRARQYAAAAAAAPAASNGGDDDAPPRFRHSQRRMAYALAYHPASEAVAVGTEFGGACVVDVNDALLGDGGDGVIAGWSERSHNAAVMDVAWLGDASDGLHTSRVATAHASGVVSVVDVSTCSLFGSKNAQNGWNRDWRHCSAYPHPESPSPPVRVATLRGHIGSVRCIRVCPGHGGGNVLATCGRDGNIFVYDLRCATVRFAPQVGASEPAHVPVRSVQFGHFASSAASPAAPPPPGRDRVSRAELTACAPGRGVAAVEWLGGHDGRTLVSGGATDGVVKLWDLRQTACRGAFLRMEDALGNANAKRAVPQPVHSFVPGGVSAADADDDAVDNGDERARQRAAGIAHMHFHSKTCRLLVSQVGGRGPISVYNAMRIGADVGAHRGRTLPERVLAGSAVRNHYARARFSPCGEYVACAADDHLDVYDLGRATRNARITEPYATDRCGQAHEAPRWEHDEGRAAHRRQWPAIGTGAGARCRARNEVTALDWSPTQPFRLVSASDAEPVCVTDFATPADERAVEEASFMIRARASAERLHAEAFGDEHDGVDETEARGGDGVGGRRNRPRPAARIPCACCASPRRAQRRHYDESEPQACWHCARGRRATRREGSDEDAT